MYGAVGYTGTWTVNDLLFDRGSYVGQMIVLLVKNATKNHFTEFSVKINTIESEFRVYTTMISMNN